MVKNILKKIGFPPANQGLQDQLNRARQDALSNLASQQQARIGAAAASPQGLASGGIAGMAISNIWQDELLKKFQETTVLTQMAGGMGADTAVVIPQTCPLSKAIIMDALLDLIELQPDMHMGQILQQVAAETRHRQYDVELAKSITELVDYLRHADTNDSSSDPRPFDSSERRNPQSIGLSGGVPPSRLPYAPRLATQLPAEPDSEQPDLFLPLG